MHPVFVSSHLTGFMTVSYKQPRKYWPDNGENGCPPTCGYGFYNRDVLIYLLRELKRYLELRPKELSYKESKHDKKEAGYVVG